MPFVNDHSQAESSTAIFKQPYLHTARAIFKSVMVIENPQFTYADDNNTFLLGTNKCSSSIAHLQGSLRLVDRQRCLRCAISNSPKFGLKSQTAVAIGGRPISNRKRRLKLKSGRSQIANDQFPISDDHCYWKWSFSICKRSLAIRKWQVSIDKRPFPIRKRPFSSRKWPISILKPRSSFESWHEHWMSANYHFISAVLNFSLHFPFE